MNDALIVPCTGLAAVSVLATLLAEELVAGDVLLLTGPLGAGKTTFVQALATAMDVGEDQYVSSPSFALVHEYRGRLPIVHMDLYRLDREEDVEAAGLLDYFDHESVCVVEWPDRLGTLTPEHRLDIRIEPDAASTRRFVLMPQGASWRQRLGRIVFPAHAGKD